jgi:hypothetical protein
MGCEPEPHMAENAPDLQDRRQICFHIGPNIQNPEAAGVPAAET